MIFMIAYLYALARYITFRAAGEDIVLALRESWFSLRAMWVHPQRKPFVEETYPIDFTEMEAVLVESSLNPVFNSGKLSQHSADLVNHQERKVI